MKREVDAAITELEADIAEQLTAHPDECTTLFVADADDIRTVIAEVRRLRTVLLVMAHNIKELAG
jgi:hypothetical protein